MGIAVARAVLSHGDAVVLGLLPVTLERVVQRAYPFAGERSGGDGSVAGAEERIREFEHFWEDEVCEKSVDLGEDRSRGWKERCRAVALDGRCEFLYPHIARPELAVPCCVPYPHGLTRTT